MTTLPTLEDLGPTGAHIMVTSCAHRIATRGIRWLMARGFTRWFSPWRIGSARPFWVPKWVPSFEKAHSAADRSTFVRSFAGGRLGWVYEEMLMRGRGAVFFPLGTGAFLSTQMEGWSREARGGKMERDRQTNVYRFTPDGAPNGWLRRLVPVKPKALILPTPAPAPQLILPAGVR